MYIRRNILILNEFFFVSRHKNSIISLKFFDKVCFHFHFYWSDKTGDSELTRSVAFHSMRKSVWERKITVSNWCVFWKQNFESY